MRSVGDRSWRNARSVVLLLFAMSGAAGLMYEVVWRRMLSVVMGGSVYATAAVLSSFMGGLFLGSIVVGRWADRWKNPLLAYGIFEVFIACFALFFAHACRGLSSLERLLYPVLENHLLVLTGVKFVAGFLLLLFPTFLMGGTFPLLSKLYLGAGISLGRGIGRLYAVNTGGAVLGTVLAGFLLIRAVGAKGTNAAAMVLSGAVGLAALAFSKVVPGLPSPSISPPQQAERKLTRPVGMVVLTAFALSGFTALCYEVLWTRVLVFVVGNTTYSFTIMLSTFLAGLALGSHLSARFLTRGKELLTTAAVIEVLIGVFAVAGIALTQSFLPAFHWLKGLFTTWSYVPYTLVRYVIASIALLPAAILFGMSFPVIVAIYAGPYEKLGSDVGRAYGSNTIGAIFGSVAAVFLLVPVLGIAGAFLLTAGINVVVGFLFLWLSPAFSSRKRVLWSVCAAGVFGFVVVLVPPRIDIAKTTEGAEGRRGKLIFYREGTAGTVAVFAHPQKGLKMMEIDGNAQVPTDVDAIQAFRLLGHLPFFVHPEPKEVLVTAFGGGITTGAILSHPVKQVDAVEICPSAFEAAKFFEEENNGALKDERLRLIVADANNYVKATHRTYDAIASDATHPAAAESWVLYTREFYEACRKLLREGGVMCQWVPLHALPTSHLKIILRTFQGVFPHASLWFARGYTIMVGTPDRLVIDAERIAKFIRKDEKTFAHLRSAHLESVPAILKNLVLDEDDVRRFAGTSPTATEDNSPLAFGEKEAVGKQLVPVNVGALASAMGEGFPRVVGATEKERKEIAAAVSIRRHYLEAVRCWQEQKPVEGLGHLEKAMASGWEDADIAWYLRWLTILAFQRYRKEERAEKAVSDFRRWAGVFPRSPWTRVALGHFLMEEAREEGDAGKIEEGLSELALAAELAPGDPIVLQDVSQAFLSEGKEEQAIPLLEKYARIMPDDPENWRDLARAYLRTERFAKAVPYMERLARLYPEDPTSWSTLAGAYMGAGRHSDARRAILRAVQLDPNNPQLRTTLRELEELPQPRPRSQRQETGQ